MEENEDNEDNEDNKYININIKFFKKQKKENNDKNINNSIEGLFDYGYNSHTIKPQEIKDMIIEKSCFIFLNYFNENNNLIEKKENHTEFNSDFNDILFNVRKSFINNNFEIINLINKNLEKNENNINNLNNNAWYIIKSDPNYRYDNYDNYNEDYILNENDIIKFGRKKYEIIKKSFKSKSMLDKNNYNISNINEEAGPAFKIDLKLNYSEDNNNKSYLIYNSRIQKEEEEQKKKCQRCQKETKYSEEDPLITLCKCNDYCHYKCLKEYLHQNNNCKITKKKNVIIYQYSKFKCDKCSYQYPTRFRIKDIKNQEIIFMLIDLKDFTSNIDYIILESLDDLKNESKTIYIIKFNDNENINIKIGRDAKNDFVIDDSFVSKKHAEIKYNKDNKQLILENKSKSYGTTVLIKGNIKMKKKDINFQVGRSYIKAKMQQL